MAQDQHRPATMVDVANLAGVSHMTVSRVLNDQRYVKPDTRKKVQEAIEALGFVPSPAARTLVTKRSSTIGLIATGLPEFGPSSALLYFSAAARAARWSVLTANMVDSDPDAVRTAVEVFVRQNVEGIAVVAGHDSTADTITALDLSVPLVLHQATPRDEMATIGADQYTGARNAVRHLADHGHRRVDHIGGPADAVDARERLRGWQDELADRGLDGRLLGVGDWSPDDGHRIGTEADLDDVSAVFVANDQMALGFLHALGDRGLSVPDDVSIVGFDDIPEAAHFSPPLTTLRQPFEQIGRDMLETLLARIDGKDLVTVAAVPELIERGSVARPSR